MILGSPLPKWGQFFKLNKDIHKPFFMENEHTLLLAESCISINLICRAYHAVNCTDRVSLWLPDYFCDQTLQSFLEPWMDIIYYPIGLDMEPQWDLLKAMKADIPIDIMLFTHYFGVYHKIDRAKEFCKNNNALLIEDCAHVLYKHEKFGVTGDFVIYSPHKQLPIPDGAILEYNENKWTENGARLFAYLTTESQMLSRRKNNRSWYVKKLIQKIVPVHRALTYSYGVHYGDGSETPHRGERISQWSYNTLCGYDYESLKRIAYIRRDNRIMMDYILHQVDSKIKSVIPADCHAPYFAVYSLEECDAPSVVVRQLLQMGLTLLYWPDLPVNMKGAGHEDALKLSQSIIILPVHQNLSPQQLIKAFARPADDNTSDIAGLSLIWDHITKSDWEQVFSRLAITNIPQDWTYGEAKAATEPWRLHRALIVNERKENVGIVQLLVRIKVGLPLAVRVNRGPLFIPEYDCPENHFAVMDIVRKHFPRLMPIVYAPYMAMSPDHLRQITAHGWRCIDPFGFPSSNVDLSQTEDELRSHLKAFWRKNLKHAEKQVTIKIQEYDKDEVMRLYDEFLKWKDIPGIPQHILNYLFYLQDTPIVMLTAHNEAGQMIAYKGLYVHGNTGTSFIAWNTDEGRATNARTLLIYRSALYLKEQGCRWYDLGGVDDITTEAVAHFKRGMSGEDYRLLGEFIHF